MKNYLNDNVDIATDVALLEAERVINKVDKIIKITHPEASKMIYTLCVEHYQLKEFSIQEMNKAEVLFKRGMSISEEDKNYFLVSHFFCYAYSIYCLNTGIDFDVTKNSQINDKDNIVISKITQILASSFRDIDNSLKDIVYGK